METENYLFYTILHFANLPQSQSEIVLPQYRASKHRNQQSPAKVFRQEGFIGATQMYFFI